MIKLKKYFRLIIQIAIYSLLGSLEYRTQTIMRIVRIFFEFTLALIFINAFFTKTDLISGWDKNSMILTLGVFNVLFASVYFFISENLYQWGDDIRNGDLDGALIKPLDTQFFLSCKRMHTQNIFRIIGGVAIIFYAINSLHLSVSVLSLSLFMMTFVSGMIICYSLLCLISTLGFWTYSNALYDLINTTISISRYPSSIFPKQVVIVLTLVPLIFLATVPARALSGKSDNLIFLSPLVAIAMFVLARKFLHYALSTYTSASS